MLLNDVTLREGDQMPGRDYSVEQKVAAGRALDDLGVGFVQAGFPVTGEKDREVIRRLGAETDTPTVALARSVTGDVDAALDAEADVVEVIIPLSDLQLEYALGKSREEAVAMAREAVDRAVDGGAEVHVTLVDAFRTEVEHLVAFVEAFDDVPFVTLADTVGARAPPTVASTLADLGSEVPLDRIGVHFHDDVGLATANALTAYDAGVAKADVSVASLGERAGNPALEEVVVAGATEYGTAFGVDEERLVPACEAVLDHLGESVEPRKGILGEEVTEHESGIHTAAMLREPSVFEPFDPAAFGGERRLLFGRGTGRSAARVLLDRVGVDPTPEHVEQLLDALAREGPMETDEALAFTESQFTDG